MSEIPNVLDKMKNDVKRREKRMYDAWIVGEQYFIRTVTMALTGRLKAVYEHELVLEDAAWIADTGRFKNFLVTGMASEVEPFPDMAIVGRGSIVDACIFTHPLPRIQK